MIEAPSYPWSPLVGPQEVEVVDKVRQLMADIAETTTRLEQMKAELERLNKQLFALHAQKAPIARIPDEILIAIFEAGAETLPMFSSAYKRRLDIPFQRTCTRVCRRWRQVAESCTSLWATTSIHDVGGIRMFECHLARHCKTGSLCIEVHHQFDCVSRDDRRFAKALSQLFACTAERLARVSLTCCPHTMQTIFSDQVEFPSLRVLNFESADDCHLRDSQAVAYSIIDLTKFSSLRHFTHARHINPFSPPAILIPSSQPIFSIDLSGIFLPSVLRALLQDCGNLQRLGLEGIVLLKQSETTSSRLEPHKLPRLEELQAWIDHGHSTDILDELALTTRPSLRSIELSCKHGDFDADDFDLVWFLRHASNLRRARLSLCDDHTHQVLATLGSELRLLPMLCEIHLDSYESEIYSFSDETGEAEPPCDIVDLLKPLVDMRWNQMVQSSPSARVVLSHNIPAERVKELRDMGMRVDLVDFIPPT
ncbi:hypothetical protein CALVIDRAFT_542776 [Calocera viscosa TUFC12733]|uniref:F-box domain-containing protein n=1 Tax=Calocera viscosa (strain TUFC12733) TaxID=1330018 RepID=A0A167GB20_CALVF|nr:hypothetical protein CALVIDRAFT_542776 [Calocera viscosa TUFC12733]